MKKLFSLFVILANFFALFASPVGPDQAKVIALNFMCQQSPSITRNSECALVYTKSNDRSTALFYVYRVGNGFVIVSADDAVIPVLGYATNGNFDAGNIPANANVWLQSYADQIAAVKEQNISANETVRRSWMELSEGRERPRQGGLRSVNPLLTTTWDQLPYYNALCPNDGENQTYTGCVATAMAQIMRYHQWPTTGFGTHRYNHATYGEQFADFVHTTYQYSLMPNELDEHSTQQQVNAVATLMYHCGVAVNMNYGVNESAAIDESARAAFLNHFGYEAQLATKSYQYYVAGYGLGGWYTNTVIEDEEWIVMLKEELDQHRPIYYSGSGSGGHAFVCDGYDANDYFHFNWGWGGLMDGFFAIGNLVIDAWDYDFSSDNTAIFVKPATEGQSLSVFNMEGITTQTFTDTLYVALTKGQSIYPCVSFNNNCKNQITFYPADADDNVSVELLSYHNQYFEIYDGPDTTGTLLLSSDQLGYDQQEGVRVISSENAVTIYYSGSLTCDDFLLRLTSVSCLPMVYTPTCQSVGIQNATITWEVFQSEQFANHTFNWQLEYGLQGFEIGTGSTIRPDDTVAYLSHLNADTYYDVYLSYTCTNGDHVTLPPITFKTEALRECLEPIGTGTYSHDYVVTSGTQYSHSQQIFTADELSARGFVAGDAIATLSVQFAVNDPLTRNMAVFMGHTDKEQFNDENDWFDTTTLVNVYPNALITFTNTNPDRWVPFHFTTPFVWDGHSNIVIAFVNNSTELDGNYYNSSFCYTWHGERSTLYKINVEGSNRLSSDRANIKLCMATSCLQPTGLTCTVLSRTEVRLDWERVYQENEWTIEYGLAGFVHGTGTTITITGNPTTQISRLENGLYDFYVRSNCGNNEFSRWQVVSARLMGDNDCVDIEGEDISTGALVTDFWSAYSITQQIYTADNLREMGLIQGSPIYSLSVQYSRTSTKERKMAIYMGNTEKTTFESNSEWFALGVLTNVFAENNFTFEARDANDSCEENCYRWETFSFDEPFFWDGSSNIVIAFVDNTGSSSDYSSSNFCQHSGTTNNTLYWRGSSLPSTSSYGTRNNQLCNIRLCSGCMYPTHITATSLSRSEVQLTWQPADQETEWTVEYGPSGFEQGTGTIVTVNDTPELLVSQLGRGRWDFYLQSNCGNGISSAWKKVKIAVGMEDLSCATIGNGTATNSIFPMGYYSNNFYTYTQQLYTATELLENGLTQGAEIGSVSFQYGGSEQTKSPITIYLGNTDRTVMNYNDGYVPLSELQEVYTGEVTFETGWVTIEFDNNFVWTGNSIVVAILNNSGNDNQTSVFYGENGSAYMSMERTTSSPISLSGDVGISRSRFRNNIQFCSGYGCTLKRTMEVVINEGDSYEFYGRILTEQGRYKHKWYVDEECDSSVTLNLIVRRIIYVVSGGARAHTGASWADAMDFQEAMDIAASFENVTPFIYVKRGTYTGNLQSTNSFEIKPKVRAYGGFAGTETPDFDLNNRNISGNRTTLSGENTRRVLYQNEDFTDNNAALFDGFTIRAGSANGVDEGGGVYMRRNCTLQNCVITANTATIAATDDNITKYGIAVYNNGGYLKNCNIYNNSVSIAGPEHRHSVYGVGVYSQNGDIDDCTIQSNITNYDGNGNSWDVQGGAVYLRNNNRVSNCNLTLNSATNGGAVYVNISDQNANITLDRCVISNNTSRKNGGGLYANDERWNPNDPENVVLTQCLIGNNACANNGGGVYDRGYNTTFRNCNIVRNAAASHAGGIYVERGGTMFLNSIIWGNKIASEHNQIEVENNRYVTFRNTALQDSYSGAITLQAENSGNGMGYPMFAGPTAEAGVDITNTIGNWTLQEGSICIDMGNNDFMTEESDLTGNVRIQQDRIDLGVYESTYNMSFPIRPEAESNIIYVTTTGAGRQDGSSWSNAVGDLQYAMDVAAGYTIPASVWVAAGTYSPSRSYIVQPNVAVYGSFVGNEPYTYDLSQRDFDNNATILDGGNAIRVMDKTCPFTANNIGNPALPFRNGESLWDGFTVQNGYCYDYYEGRENRYGAGYLLDNTTLLHCTFTQNNRHALYAKNCVLSYCQFNHNTGNGLVGEQVTIDHSTAIGNSEKGMKLSNNSDIKYSTLNENGYGGITLANSKMTECTVSNNSFNDFGITSSDSHITNSFVTNNSGGGVNSSRDIYINVNIANNDRSSYGAGVYTTTETQFVNCNIVRNYNRYASNTASGGVYASSSSSTFTNCIIWGNVTFRVPASSNIYGDATYSYCAIEGGATGTANITLDSLNSGSDTNAYYPNFVNPSDTAGHVYRNDYDWNLAAGSACINRGIPTTTSLNLPPYDLGGSLRIKQQQIDIGAYEYGDVMVTRIQDSVCSGEEYTFDDDPDHYIFHREPGNYIDTFTNYQNNADYLIYVNLKVNDKYDLYLQESICEGDVYMFDGQPRSEAGDYTAYYQTASGCDSNVTVNLTVLPHSYNTITVTCCDSYTWNNETYNVSGEYQQIFEAANGCDSIVTLYLTVNHSDTVEFYQTACTSYVWNGITYRQSGNYTQVLHNHNGCDSVITMHLTILDVLTSEFSVATCEQYNWDEITYTTSGDKVRQFVSSQGCDSIVTLHLTLYQPTESAQHLTVCDRYEWNGESYTTSGIYQKNFTNAHGCDSTATLYLTVNYSSTYEFDDVACDSYTWNNQTYTTSGDYEQVLTNAVGCDSTVTLHLTINYSNSYEFDAVACDSYTWNNQTYTTSGDYEQVFTNAVGCDSIVTLHLTINHSNSYEFDDVACDSYTWNNQTYTTSGDYEQVLTNAVGCDSTVTLHLTVNYSSQTELTVVACDEYIWNNISYYNSGDYDQVFTNAAGCDSTVTLHLTIHRSAAVDDYLTICENELPQSYSDTIFEAGTATGTYEVHLLTQHGCDSTVTLHLTIIPTPMPQLIINGTITACSSSSATLSVEGDYATYAWSTEETTSTIEVTTPGYYWVEVTDENGCTTLSETSQLGVSTLIPETPSICMVGVENGHNLVIWEEMSDNANVQNYRIYRENEQANVYELLATIPATQPNVYEDITADPSVRAYRYKVTAMDVCQGETPMSELHKSVHLTINRGIGNTWNLIWSHYEGVEFSSYRLYRGTTNNNMELIATLPSTLTSYTDFENLDGALFYQIEVVMNSSCLLHRDTTYTGSRSNIVYNGERVYTETTVDACDNYEWFDNTFTQSGDYEHSYTSELGYECTATLHLNIHPSVTTTENLTISENDLPYTYGDTIFEVGTPLSSTYTFHFLTQYGCDSTVTLHLTITTGIEENAENGELTLFPNPTTGIIQIQYVTPHNNFENIEIQLFNIYGQKLLSLPMQSEHAVIDLSPYATGMYLVKLIQHHKVMAIRKIVKE